MGQRLASIDALRSFDMFWIMGGDALVRAICKLSDYPAVQQFADQFSHVEWEGFRFYDLIFPLFLFLVGVVLPFSLGKYAADPDGRRKAKIRICLREHAGAAGVRLRRAAQQVRPEQAI